MELPVLVETVATLLHHALDHCNSARGICSDAELAADPIQELSDHCFPRLSCPPTEQHFTISIDSGTPGSKRCAAAIVRWRE